MVKDIVETTEKECDDEECSKVEDQNFTWVLCQCLTEILKQSESKHIFYVTLISTEVQGNTPVVGN